MKTTKKKSRLTCGVREAKTRLSQLLEEVRQGAEILITDRGRPIGKLVGLEPGDLSLEERLARLSQQRCIEPKNARPCCSLPPPLPMMSADVAQQFLQADRER